MTRDTAEDMMALADDVAEFQTEQELDLVWEALAFLNEPEYLARAEAVNDMCDMMEMYGSIPVYCECE